MILKTTELTGAALVWAVGQANKWVDLPTDSVEAGRIWHLDPEKIPGGSVLSRSQFNPLNNWPDAEKIMVTHGILAEKKSAVSILSDELSRNKERFVAGKGSVWSKTRVLATGNTIPVAAMRCYVLSEPGEEIDIEETNNGSFFFRTDLLTAVLNRGFDINIKDKNGDTPLMIAASRGETKLADNPYHFKANNHLDVVKIFLARGADADAKNNKGQTALDIALDNMSTCHPDHAPKYVEIVRMIEIHQGIRIDEGEVQQERANPQVLAHEPS